MALRSMTKTAEEIIGSSDRTNSPVLRRGGDPMLFLLEGNADLQFNPAPNDASQRGFV